MNTQAVLQELQALLKETFDGTKPTQYLDHHTSIRSTLDALSHIQASQQPNSGHPSIAGHVRHMLLHLRVVLAWVQGNPPENVDWVGSFSPPRVTVEEWQALKQELFATRDEVEQCLVSLSPEQFAEAGFGMGLLAHLAYHLGAIRQLVHLV